MKESDIPEIKALIHTREVLEEWIDYNPGPGCPLKLKIETQVDFFRGSGKNKHLSSMLTTKGGAILVAEAMLEKQARIEIKLINERLEVLGVER